MINNALPPFYGSQCIIGVRPWTVDVVLYRKC